MRLSQVGPMRMRGGGKEKQHVSIVVIGHVDSGVVAGCYFFVVFAYMRSSGVFLTGTQVVGVCFVPHSTNAHELLVCLHDSRL